jgi:glutathione S-transferase
LPGDPDGDARVIELMDYVIGTLHGQGFTRIFTTDRFTPNEADFETVKAQGLDIVKRGFAVVNDDLSPQGYVMGCQSALKSIHLTASNNVQQESKVMPFLAPFYAA